MLVVSESSYENASCFDMVSVNIPWCVHENCSLIQAYSMKNTKMFLQINDAFT